MHISAITFLSRMTLYTKHFFNVLNFYIGYFVIQHLSLIACPQAATVEYDVPHFLLEFSEQNLFIIQNGIE